VHAVSALQGPFQCFKDIRTDKNIGNQSGSVRISSKQTGRNTKCSWDNSVYWWRDIS